MSAAVRTGRLANILMASENGQTTTSTTTTTRPSLFLFYFGFPRLLSYYLHVIDYLRRKKKKKKKIAQGRIGSKRFRYLRADEHCAPSTTLGWWRKCV